MLEYLMEQGLERRLRRFDGMPRLHAREHLDPLAAAIAEGIPTGA
jgi:hypothetical protein